MIILIRSKRRIDMEQLFCDLCDDFVNHSIITKKETFNILGKEKITIKSKMYERPLSLKDFGHDFKLTG
jgi:hypothetical protein